MLDYFTHGMIMAFIYFQAVVLIIIISNIIQLHLINRKKELINYPCISILVPARDEERKIGKCIYSLLRQDYPNYEVIVLDDQSSDNTADILHNIKIEYPRLIILAGKPLPEGFTGKNWACAQLAQYAHGELLLFTDADTEFQPYALREISHVMVGENADLLTGYPRQKMISWGERLLVPFFLWVVMCFVPLWLAYRLRIRYLSAAVGQMMLFKREAYQKVGAHHALGTAIVEDIALARNIKRAGLCWRVMNLTDMITCRMYLGGQEAFKGFAKNLFATFDYRISEFLFVYFWLGAMFLEPLIVLVLKIFGFAPTAFYSELAICICLSVLIWFISYMELRLPLSLSFIYPITIIANEIVAFQSLLLSITGQLSWKGRTLPRAKWRWL
jgi:chlorobactene glucosyltransferase